MFEQSAGPRISSFWSLRDQQAFDTHNAAALRSSF